MDYMKKKEDFFVKYTNKFLTKYCYNYNLVTLLSVMGLTFMIYIFVRSFSFFYFPITESSIHFQHPGSLIFDRLIDFHDFILIYLIFILSIFSWFLVWSVRVYGTFRYLFFISVFMDLSRLFYIFIKSTHTFYTFPIRTHIFFSSFYKILVPNSKEDLTRSFLFDFFKKFYYLSLKSDNYSFIYSTRRQTHAPTLEVIWTILPSIILIFIAIPSLYLLYMLDYVEPLSFAVKVIGHQWYWSYEIGSSAPIFKSINNVTFSSFDSYMIPDNLSNLRLLEVDNVLFVPAGLPLTFLVTSTDVIHSWAVPSLGIKVDAIPGRLNQVCLSVFDINTYYGQCSELCGVNHGFMPINVVSVVDNLQI